MPAEQTADAFANVGLVAVSFGICLLLILLKTRLPRLNGKSSNMNAVQSAHTRVTPRVGGLAIFGAWLIGMTLISDAVSTDVQKVLLAAALVFFVGLAEDLGFDLSPSSRLIAACLASILAIWLLPGWLPRTDIPVFDIGVATVFVGVPLTLLLTVGISNGFNLVDGVNGLAALSAVAASVAMAMLATRVGDHHMSDLLLLLAASLCGFFLLNYPFGLIFLGDAGAYTIGFVLSWFGIILLRTSDELTPWAVLLTMFWPTMDTLMAMYRRRRRQSAAMAPDRLHTHQLIMRALEICWFGKNKRHITNPLATALLAPFVIAPPIAGVLLWDQSLLAFLIVISLCGLTPAFYMSVAPTIKRILRARRATGG